MVVAGLPILCWTSVFKLLCPSMNKNAGFFVLTINPTAPIYIIGPTLCQNIGMLRGVGVDYLPVSSSLVGSSVMSPYLH